MDPTLSVEQDARRLSAASRLGAPLAPPVPCTRIPLRYYAGSLILLVLGLAALAGHLLLAAHPTPLLVLAAAGLLPASAFLIPWALWRGSLAVHQRGAVLTRFGREVVFAFDEIERLSIDEQEHLDRGAPVGLVRKLALRSATGSAGFRSLWLDGRDDPLGAAVGRLLDGVTEAFEARLAAGATLRGRGWTLDPQGLRVGPLVVPLAQVSEVGTLQKRVSLWRGEDERPFLTTPIASDNARVLQRLLARRLEGRPAGHRQSGPSGLGRVLIERKSGPVLVGGLACVGAASLAISLALLRTEPGARWVTGIIGGVLLLGAWAARRGREAVHECGLTRQGVLGRRELRYADVDRLSYSATRQYHNGVYTGTRYSLRCAAPGGRPITILGWGRGSEGNLDGLRDHIAGVVAERMRSRLAAEGEVAWTRGLRLTPTGVRFQRSRLVGRGPDVFLPWAALRYEIEAGCFHLYEADAAKPSLSVGCDSENFYPGHVLFGKLPGEAAPHG